MRLNAYLARAGVASRRGADKLIKEGRVKVNGRVGQLNSEVSPEDKVELNGRPVRVQELRYILMNKPPRIVTSLKDPEGRPVITDLLDIKERVVPVGRLDVNTTGAILLTNDGELANKLMHPKYKVNKVYEAEVKGLVTNEILNKLSNGVILEDGKTAPAKTRKLTNDRVEITIHEGRNHQVKRMLAAVGLQVLRLHRRKYGPLELHGLKIGQWRELTPAEVKQLQS